MSKPTTAPPPFRRCLSTGGGGLAFAIVADQTVFHSLPSAMLFEPIDTDVSFIE